MKLNYLDKYVSSNLCTSVDLEKHAALVYTAKIFRHVQDDIKSAVNKCRMLVVFQSEGKDIFKIVDEYKETFDVSFDKQLDEYTCNCKKITRMGLLCNHVFGVLKNNDILTIPHKYVVGRWKKSHLLSHVHGLNLDELHSYATDDETKRLTGRIMTSVFGWMLRFEGEVSKLSYFLAAIDVSGKSIAGDEENTQVSNKKQMFKSFYGAIALDTVDVHPPDVVKTKRSGSRYISRIETAKQEKKPMHRCRKCKHKS